ncbi:MAG: hypothetical protein ACTSPY_04155 [Candidatus Helarchaeota archaeon]
MVTGTMRSYGEGMRNIFVMKYTLSGQTLSPTKTNLFIFHSFAL